jgi:diguanylate cyclase (GGDEF)-like protein/PAS domain S-box-containing protein
VVLLVLALVWSVAAYAEGIASTFEGKLFWSRIRYLGVAGVPPLWLLFAIGFTRRRTTPLAIGLLFLVPTITCALIFGALIFGAGASGDGGPALVWTSVEAPARATGNLVFEHGPWFWWAVLGYGVLAVLLGDVVLLSALRVAERTHRRQLLAMVGASLIPLALYLLYLGGLTPFRDVDPTPLGFGFAGILLAWTLHRHRLFDLAPTAFRRVMETIPDLLLVVGEDGRIAFANAAAGRLLGRAPADMAGREIAALWPAWQGLISHASQTQPAVVEVEPRPGETRELEVRILRLGEDGSASGHVLIGQDISERRSFERRIEEMAYNDPLTGLPNRRALLEFARKVLSMSRRGQSSAALVFLDLQLFKEINDALGHSIGDTVLQSVSSRLAAVTRAENMLARIGGDEFAAILQNCDVDGALGAAHRMLKELEAPFEIEGASLHVSATAGIAMYPEHGLTVSDLLRHADMAMYQARHHGRPAAAFDPEDQLFTAEHLRLESDLRSALDGAELFLEYQPIVDAITGDTVAVEALLRWQHPERGVLKPDQFLPIAHRRGLTSSLDRFAMRRALEQLAPHRVDIAVNVAGSTLSEEGLSDFVAEVLRAAEVEPRRLILEITETELVLPERARPVISAIRALGVRIATDDFGSGFSSLTYLRTLPLDVVKVDRALVEAIGRGVEDEAILAAILRVAKSLSLAVVAEGVERSDQKDWLTEHTCGMLQGFLFGRPERIEQLELSLPPLGAPDDAPEDAERP